MNTIDFKKYFFFLFLKLFLLIFFLSSNLAVARSPKWDFSKADASDPVIDTTYAPHKHIKSQQRVVEINLPARKLTVYDKDVPIKSYAIAVGSRINYTPIGERKITRVIWNPWWHPPSSEWAKEEPVMPPGPMNPMGPVKIDIGETLFIHGTNEEYTVGRPVTHGCVRLKNADAKELAYWLQRNYGVYYNDAQFEQELIAHKEDITIPIVPPIGVKVIYNLVEISDGMLHVYSDIYLQYEEKQRLIEQALMQAGYAKDKIRTKILERELSKANNKDLNLKLSKILRSSKKRTQELENQKTFTED